MKKRNRRMIFAGIGAAALLMLLLWPGLPWSARFRHTLTKLATKTEMKVAAWQGETPRLISLSGKIITLRSGKEAMSGAEIEALDSFSGWAAMADQSGEFVLRDLLWYPRARYTLIIRANEHQVRQLQVAAPNVFPENGVANLGELEFERGCEIAPADIPGANSISYVNFDSRNLEYYRELFNRLTAGLETDEQKLDAINRHVAARFTSSATKKGHYPPREVLEHGSYSRRNMAMTLATLAEAGNYKTRILDLIDRATPPIAHMVTEIYYGNSWHLHDPVIGAAFRDRRGRIASYKELRLDTGLITPGVVPQDLSRALSYPEEWMPRVYGSGFHHYYYIRKK